MVASGSRTLTSNTAFCIWHRVCAMQDFDAASESECF